MERCTGAHLPNRVAQCIDTGHQQVRPTVKQVHCKEERSTRNPIAAVVRIWGVCPTSDTGGMRSAVPPYACYSVDVETRQFVKVPSAGVRRA